MERSVSELQVNGNGVPYMKKAGLIRLVLFFILLLTLPVSIFSCGFIGGIFSGDEGSDEGGGGEENGDGDEEVTYELTIYYRYMGVDASLVSTSRPLVFFIMPVNEDGEIEEDPFDPVVKNGYIPSGSVKAEVGEGSYGLFLFDDADSSGYPSYLEKYVIYYGYAQSDTAFDSVYIDSNQSVFIEMNDDFVWRRVYIVSPRSGEIMESDFFVYGGISEEEGSSSVESVSLDIDGSERGWAQVDWENDTWMYPAENNLFNEIELEEYENGWHTLTAFAWDASGEQIDSYSISFEEHDGSMIFIRTPTDEETYYDDFTVSGGFTGGTDGVSIQVYVDYAYMGDASLNSDDGRQWEYSLDISSLTNGEHTLFVRANFTEGGLQSMDSESVVFYSYTGGGGT